jgi:transposase
MSTEAATLPSNVDQLQAIIAAQASTIDEQSSTIDELHTKLRKLEHHLQQLLRARYGPRAERFDAAQLALFDAAADESAAPRAVAPETVVKEHRRRGGGGRSELPDHLERRIVEYDLSPAEKLCPCCQRERERIGAEVSEQLEYEPAVIYVLRHVRHKYACRACQEHVATAPAAAKPIEKGLPGPGLLSALVVSKYHDHLPLYRLEDVFSRSGVELARSTLCRWALATAELLRPLYDLLVERVLQSQVIHTDDTPMPVRDDELAKTRTARLWVYCGDWRQRYTVYDYTTSRRRDGPATFLKDFEGYLQADAYGGYDGIYAGGKVTQVLCWAHARRKFYEARTVQPDEAHAALGFIARLYAVEDELTKLRYSISLASDLVQVTRKWHRQRRRVRQKESLPILREFYSWLAATQRSVLPKSPLGQAIGYVLPRWDGLTRYCTDGILAIDNNLSERMIRPCAIGRKNYLFFGSDNGGEAAAVLYSVLASAKAHAVEPWLYVRDLLETFARNAAPALDQLLPEVWLRAHPHARRQRPR